METILQTGKTDIMKTVNAAADAIFTWVTNEGKGVVHDLLFALLAGFGGEGVAYLGLTVLGYRGFAFSHLSALHMAGLFFLVDRARAAGRASRVNSGN